jgi:hypothetical protein
MGVRIESGCSRGDKDLEECEDVIDGTLEGVFDFSGKTGV